jgi:hypothetical protein
VPRAGEGQDLVAAGVQLRQPQRGLVGLAAGGEEHGAGQRLGEDRHELARQLGHVTREEAAEQVHDAPAGVAHRLEDRRVTVAERRAHLPGGEVEDPPPVLGRQPAARRVLDEQVGELAAVADEVVAAGAALVGVGAPGGAIGGGLGCAQGHADMSALAI